MTEPPERLPDDPPDSGLQGIAQIAAHICGTPMAVVTLLDAVRYEFKAVIGLVLQSPPAREHAFCAHAIESGSTFVVRDTLTDDRFKSHPMVCGAPHVRFYAGAPLRTAGGRALGTLCVFDRVPRDLTPEQRTLLEALARQVVTHLELQLQLRERKRADEERRSESMRLDALLQHLRSAILFEDENRRILHANTAFCDRFAAPARPADIVGLDCARAAEQSSQLFSAPDDFQRRVAEIVSRREPVLAEPLRMADGRTLERDYIPVIAPDGFRGHLWKYDDVSDRNRDERRLNLMYAVALALADATSVEDAGARVLPALGTTVGCEGAAFWEVDDDHAVLVCRGLWTRGVTPAAAAYREITQATVFHRGEGLPGHVWVREEPLWCAALADSPQFIRRGLLVHPELSQALIVPVRAAGHVLGVIELIGTHLEPPDDTVLRLLGAIGDQIGSFLERRRAEEARQGVQRRKAAILDAALDCIVTMDGHGIVREFNPAAHRTFGYTREEAIGRPLADLIVPPRLRAAHTAGLARLMRTGTSQIVGRRLEMSAVRKDGTEFPVELAITQMPTLPVMFTGFIRDVTEQRLAEERLRASELRTRAIVDHMLEGVVICDMAGTIDVFNPAAERMFGYSASETVGRDVRMLLPQTADYQAEDFVQRGYEAAIGRVTEWQGRRATGEVFPLEVLLSEFDTATGRRLVGNLRDLSQRGEIERLKKRFVSMVSHELRTPLTSIRGALSLLTAEAGLTDDARTLLQIAERNSVRLTGLINDILDLERMESGHFELHCSDVLLDTLIERAIDAVGATAAAAGVAIDAVPTGLRIHADGQRVTQVLVNLLSNAVKFSPAGSRVTIAAQHGPALVDITVTDEGRGIPADMQELIFEPFRQVESADGSQKGGSGLGLTISRALIERHGGTLRVRSEPGRGSAFTLTVPPAVGAPPEAT